MCYRAAAGAAFAQAQADVVALIRDDAEAPDVEVSQDDFGFTWLVVAVDKHDVSGLCTDLRNRRCSLQRQGCISQCPIRSVSLAIGIGDLDESRRPVRRRSLLARNLVQRYPNLHPIGRRLPTCNIAE